MEVRMPEKVISIVRQDGDYLLIADIVKGYNGRIHKSLIADNGLEVINGIFSVSKTLYGTWFQETMSKAFEELCELFYSHIPLFVKKHEDILENPRFYSIIAPRTFYEGMFVGSSAVTLGQMLLLWKNEPVFSYECECSGKMVIYRFLGSPLSGGCTALCVCLDCWKKSNTKKVNFNTLWQTALKNKNPIEPFSKNPIAVKGLIAILEGRLDQESAVGADDFRGVSGDMTITVGGRTISNETFTSMMFDKN